MHGFSPLVGSGARGNLRAFFFFQDHKCSDEEMVTSVDLSSPGTPLNEQPRPHNIGSSPVIILTCPSVVHHTPNKQSHSQSIGSSPAIIPTHPSVINHTPNKQLHPQSGSSPGIILTHPSVLDHTPNNSDKSGHSPLHSSLVLQTPGGHYAVLSPISEGGKESSAIEGVSKYACNI